MRPRDRDRSERRRSGSFFFVWRAWRPRTAAAPPRSCAGPGCSKPSHHRRRQKSSIRSTRSTESCPHPRRKPGPSLRSPLRVASRARLGSRRLASYGGPTHDCCPGAGIWEISGQLIQIKRLDQTRRNYELGSERRLEMTSASGTSVKRSRPRLLSGFLMALALGASQVAIADEAEEANERERTEALEASRDWLGGIPAAPTEDWEIGFGGRLYDNWFEALATDEPEGTHRRTPRSDSSRVRPPGAARNATAGITRAGTAPTPVVRTPPASSAFRP